MFLNIKTIKNKIAILAALGIFAFNFNGLSQSLETLEYEIGTKLFSIGNYKLSKKSTSDSTLYYSYSEVTVPYLFSEYKVTFKGETHFVGDTMRYCKVTVWVNGKIREWNTTVYQDNKYKITRKKEGEKPESSFLYVPAIKVTSSSLFFEEPIGVSHNYAELFGYFNKIESTSKNTYLLTDTETGRTTEYIYKKGQIWETKIDYPIMTFGLKRIK